MKTEFKERPFLKGTKILILGVAVVVLATSLAHAQKNLVSPIAAQAAAQAGQKAGTGVTDTSAMKPPPSSIHSQGASAAPAVVSPSSAPSLTLPVSTPTAAVAAPLPVPATPGMAQAAATLKSAETDVPEAVKNVIKRLDSSADDITVEDLNGARQAIAKVEVLIELEKKLADLQKARAEREGRSSLSGAIPASALGGPGMAAAQGNYPIDAMPASLDIIRIVGGAGHYKVVTKGYDGSPKTLEVGDKMSDGSVISSISATGVTLDNKGDKRVVRIKNVDRVFGGTP